MLKPIFRWRGSMVGDGVELVGVSQTGDLVGVELEDIILIYLDGEGVW